MINNKELRVGNLVFEDPKLLTLHVIVWYNLGLDDVPFEPIPLTPEILVKCGFEKTDGNNYRFGRFHLRYVMESTYSFAWKTDALDYGKGTKSTVLNHLHQLQNLYFALTGEEININL